MATILVVDDRATNRELLVTLLGYAGHQLLEASDGEQALALARTQHPDLIITDIVMPKMDGYEFARQVRADPTISSTQVIFYTSSYIVAETRSLAQACGVSVVISKPIEPEDFLHQIHAALETKAPTAIPSAPENFHLEHMQLLTDTLAHKVDELEAEVTERKRAQTLLGESEELFRTAFQYSPIGMCLVTLDGKFQFINESLAALLGYTPEELIGRHFNDFTDPIDREVGSDMINRLLAGEVPSVSFEKRYERKNGEQVWAHVTSTLLHDPTGQPLHFITHVQNISERKQAEGALRESEARFSKIFHVSPIGINIFGLADGRSVDVNEAYLQIVGYAREEVIGHTATELKLFVDERARDIWLANLRQGQGIRNQSARISRKSGELRDVLASIDVIDVSGKAMALVVALDVTEMRQAEEHIHYQANLLENVSDAIIATDLDSKVTRWNLAAEEIYGWRASEVLGKPLNEILQTEYPAGLSQVAIFREFLDQKLWKGEVTQTRKDGQKIAVLSSVSLVTDEVSGAPIAMVAVNRDITQRKQVEENLRILNTQLEQRVAERTAELTHANHAKDEFLANMSHELRTPLNTILGLSEILLEQRRGPLNEAQVRALELVASSGQHLLGLINDILEVSKIEAGKLQIHPEVISVQEVCASSLNFVKELAIKKSITLDYWNDAELDRMFADPQRLKQILVNLLNNAVKFTPEHGNVSLEVETNAERDQLRFIISDTGIGISDENLHKLFTPFTQLESSLARQYAGTGLGLVLVLKFTELHGGSIHVESELGKGSRFTVTFPWNESLTYTKNPAEPLPAVVEPETASPTPAQSVEPILLVEDNAANILLLEDYLQDHGFPVALARNGFEAIDQAEKLNPSLILMDIQLPEMDGLEVIRRLRANPRFTSTPIIALTALAMRGDRERCLEAGADDYMSKPIRLKELLKVITNLLELKKASSN